VYFCLQKLGSVDVYTQARCQGKFFKFRPKFGHAFPNTYRKFEGAGRPGARGDVIGPWGYRTCGIPPQVGDYRHPAGTVR